MQTESYVYFCQQEIGLPIQPYLFDYLNPSRNAFSLACDISLRSISKVNVDSIFFPLIKSPSFMFVDAAASYL